MMNLHSFLKQNHLSISQFAAEVDSTAGTISRVADGLVVPRRALMLRIYVATSGRVSPNDLVGIGMEIDGGGGNAE